MRLITIDGRLGGDAEVVTTKDGKKYVRFTIANNTFSNGQEETEWFDVSCYNPYYVENVDKLKKGRYVFVCGDIKSKVNVNNNTVYLNHYVRANSIGNLGGGNGNRNNDSSQQQEEQVSTYTGSTPSFMQERPVEAQPTPAPVQEPAYSVSVEGNGDDLPF